MFVSKIDEDNEESRMEVFTEVFTAMAINLDINSQRLIKYQEVTYENFF